jgi:amino acid transporter
VFAPRGDEAPTAANWATFLTWSLVGAAASSVLLLITASAFLWLLLYAWAMVLVVILRVRAPQAERPFRMPALPILAPIGIVTILWTDWTVLVSMPASAGLALVFLAVAFVTPLLQRNALPVAESREAP